MGKLRALQLLRCPGSSTKRRGEAAPPGPPAYALSSVRLLTRRRRKLLRPPSRLLCLIRTMTYEPRTIALLTELMHPPIAPDHGPVQRIHNKMFEEGRPVYASFQVTPMGAVLSNPVTQPGAASSVAFLRDRIQFREELSGVGPEEFAQRVRVLSSAGAEARRLQLFTAQVVTIRTLINPRSFDDARLFLRSGVFGFGEELADFGRDPQLYGLRLAFGATKEMPQAFGLRVESYAQDARSLFVEAQGNFGPTIAARGLEAAGDNVLETYRFVTDRACPFLGRFDVPQQA